MELTTLRYFRTIVATGHLTRAARELGVTQPTLSAMLKKLESEAGTPLLHRTPRGVELTEAGRLFARHAEDALRQADAALHAARQLAGLERGSLRIGGGATATTYLLPRVVSQLRRLHPGLRFFVREGGSSAIAAAVLSGELDLGIVTLPVSLPEADSLVRVPLVEDELRLIVPPSTPLAGQSTFRWKDLDGQSLVAFEAGTAVRDMIDRAASAAGVALAVVMELRSIESIKSMVAEGIGVGFVSRFALSPEGPFGPGASCRDSTLSRRLALIRRRDRAPAPAAVEFERALTSSVAAVHTRKRTSR